MRGALVFGMACVITRRETKQIKKRGKTRQNEATKMTQGCKLQSGTKARVAGHAVKE